jgi:hypothetical protein
VTKQGEEEVAVAEAEAEVAEAVKALISLRAATPIGVQAKYRRLLEKQWRKRVRMRAECCRWCCCSRSLALLQLGVPLLLLLLLIGVLA